MKQAIQTSVRSVRLVKIIVDPLTGRRVLVQPLPFGQGTYLRLRLMRIPKSFRRVHRFLRAGKDNREWEAYLAYKGTIPWKHSIPLSSVVSYLRWRGPALRQVS